MRIAPILFALLATTAYAEQQMPRTLGFQEVPLNGSFESIPNKYKSDCSSGSDKRYVFCTYKEKAEDIPLVAEITFVNRFVSEVSVYYPTIRHNDVWLALRMKYGKESRRDDTGINWYASEPAPDNPSPDELTLLKVAPEQPKPDGFNYQSMRYGVYKYTSMAAAREAYERKMREHDQKIKSLSGKL